MYITTVTCNRRRNTIFNFVNRPFPSSNLMMSIKNSEYFKYNISYKLSFMEIDLLVFAMEANFVKTRPKITNATLSEV